MILTIKNTELPIHEVLISQAEGDVLWSASVLLATMEGYNLFEEGTFFEIDFMGEPYLFLFSGKSISRNDPEEVTIRIEGMSPALLLQEPRAERKAISIDEPMQFQDIVESILGRPVVWEFLSWVIPAHRVVATETTPIALVVSLLDQVGAILECRPTGELAVRYKYIVDPTKYSTSTIDQAYTDSDHRLSVDEHYEVRDGYNKFRVSEMDTAYSDRIEFVPDEGTEISGTLKVYPYPWRTSFRLWTTSDTGDVLLEDQIWEIRIETQVVEFVRGAASVQYPAESIVSVTWHSTPLGTVVCEAHTTELSAPIGVHEGYGLATIVYTTDCATYRTSAPDNSHAQYVIEEI